jgi:predicted amidohydrolase
MSMVKVTLVQKGPVLGDKEANLRTMDKEVRKASKKGSHLVVFGELFLTGYRIKDRVARLAETRSGPSIKGLKRTAKDTGSYILFGLPERDEKVRGLIYNSAALIGPDGEVDIYRKWFLPNFGPFEEKIHYTPGKDIRIFETDFGRLGVFICYDIFFPELAKALTLKGADMLAILSAAPSSSKHFFELLSQARAIENALPVAYCNLVGVEEGLKFFGGSVIIGPRGNILAKAKVYEEDVISADVDLKEVDFARFHRPTVRDTRPEAFEHLKGH